MNAANAAIIKLAAGTKVKNILGSSEGPVKPSAKQFWTNAIALQGQATKWPLHCCIQGCKNQAVHGSHVKIRALSTWGYQWYLIPTCPKHNRGASRAVRCCSHLEAAAGVQEHFRCWVPMTLGTTTPGNMPTK